MDFLNYKDHIEEGDTVIVYISNDNLTPLKITKNEIYQTKFGAIRHNEVIGKKFGSKYDSAKGYVYLLFPTPELWSLSLPHRTQILYATDIARIVFELNLTPGKVVCESGTGSGSLSHALVRAVAPIGHVHTVEFHKERSEKARQEFLDHGVAKHITVYNRDVIEDGFPSETDHIADAVFFDIPAPYSAIDHVKRALKLSGGEFCNFSPCIEQVQKTCDALREKGFVELKTIEVINHSTSVKTTAMPMPDFGVDLKTLMNENIIPNFENPEIGYYTKREKKKAMKKAKTMSSSKEEVIDENDGKPILEDCNYNCKSTLAKKQKYGHTGYLTFACLPPREPKISMEE